jgi:hypothetical protein
MYEGGSFQVHLRTLTSSKKTIKNTATIEYGIPASRRLITPPPSLLWSGLLTPDGNHASAFTSFWTEDSSAMAWSGPFLHEAGPPIEVQASIEDITVPKRRGAHVSEVHLIIRDESSIAFPLIVDDQFRIGLWRWLIATQSQRDSHSKRNRDVCVLHMFLSPGELQATYKSLSYHSAAVAVTVPS